MKRLAQTPGLLVALSVVVMSQALAQQSLPPLNDNSGYGGYNNNYGGGYAPPSTGGYGGYNAAPLQGRVSTAPAGTALSATFGQALSSEYARVGDRFTASLGTPITGADGSVLLPSGSQLEAQVVQVTPAGRTGRQGRLDIRFTAAMLPNGQRVPLSARLQTEDGTGVLSGGTTKGRIGRAALNTGVGAGLGAALGTAMGPLSGGKVGRGAIYGTAIGGGLGAAKALWNKGDEAVLEAGQPVNIVLDQPLTVSPQAAPSYAQPSYNNYGGNSGGGFTPYGQGGQPQYNNYGY